MAENVPVNVDKGAATDDLFELSYKRPRPVDSLSSETEKIYLPRRKICHYVSEDEEEQVESSESEGRESEEGREVEESEGDEGENDEESDQVDKEAESEGENEGDEGEWDEESEQVDKEAECEGEEVQAQPTEGTMPLVITVDPIMLDCSICLKLLRSPVFQCDSGHLGCDSCCKKILNVCPSCSLPIGVNRNIAVERIVESARTSCRNMLHGCTEKVSYLNKFDHEKTCKYTPIPCPEQGCNYSGVYNCLYTHFAQKHPCSPKQVIFNDLKLVSAYDTERKNLLQERDEKVLFVLNCVTDPLGKFVNVICLAPNASDMKFSYKLKARRGDNSIILKTSMELTPDYSAELVKEKCLLITNEFHCDNGVLDLELIIRKAS